jgi:transcriptional regulator with XRE-family HTH domain
MKKSVFSHEQKAFCRVLRRAREEANVTQEELARRLSKTQSEISKCERGETRLDLVQLRQWCRALKVQLMDFVREFESSLTRR